MTFFLAPLPLYQCCTLGKPATSPKSTLNRGCGGCGNFQGDSNIMATIVGLAKMGKFTHLEFTHLMCCR